LAEGPEQPFRDAERARRNFGDLYYNRSKRASQAGSERTAWNMTAIGFHGQQAVEEMLKAVLAIHAVRFGKLHEIGQILALLRQNNIAFPSEFEELRTAAELA
jgi:HEPN domain-containing protein